MDVITITSKLEKKIEELEACRNTILDASEKKATDQSDYDKQIAITVLKLKNEMISEFEGVKIDKLPATLIPLVAKGICWKECLEKEKSDSGYKGLIAIIEAIKSELNGYQSISKHLE